MLLNVAQEVASRSIVLVKDPDPYKYQVRMWTFSNTIRQ